MVKKCKCAINCGCPTDLYNKLEAILNKYSNEPMRTLILPTKESALISEKEIAKSLLVSGEHISALKREGAIVSTSNPESTNYIPYNPANQKKGKHSTIVGVSSKINRNDKYQAPVVLKIPENISIVSTSSPSNTFSENVINLFMNERQRFIIHISSNPDDELFRFSGKFVKRNALSNEDEEEVGYVIATRLCSSKELKNEIKQMLIWMGINPMIAYRQFRKMCIEQCFVRTQTDRGFTIVQNECHEDLMKVIEVNIKEQHYNSGYPPIHDRQTLAARYLDNDWD